MLVLSRKKDETIRICDNIEVKVLEVRGDRIRLGIVAPQDVRVVRQELVPERGTASGSVEEDVLVALADEPRQEDTLRSGNAHEHKPRNHNQRARRPR